MGHMEPKTQETPSARQRILDAANELFYMRGIHATGVDAIINKARVAKLTLYKYFAGKDELVAAFLNERDRRWNEWMRSFYEGHTDPREKILSVFDALEAWMRAEGFRGCAFLNTAMELANPDHPARLAVKAHKVGLRDLFEDLAKQAGLTSPGETAEQLLMLYEGAIASEVIGSVENAVAKARRAAERLLREPPA